MFISVEQRPETPNLSTLPIAIAMPVSSALADDAAARRAESPVESPQVMEELLIEEVSIDGMCGVY